MQTVIELLQRMVQHDTVSDELSGRTGSEQALVETLEALAASWSLQTRRLPVPGFADQLLITCNATVDDAPWVLFDSHLDTVGIEGMTIDPFAGDIRDGKVFGRGACDTKGTGAAMLWALKQYAQRAARPNAIALLFSVDEEAQMAGIQQFVEHDLPTLGLDFRGAVVGEPSRGLPIVAHLGLIRWTLKTQGRAAHSSIPALGQSAITPMVELVRAIEQQYIPTVTATHPRCGNAACAVTTFHSGQSPNVIPDTCVVQIDRRVAPGESFEALSAGLRAVLDPVGVAYELVEDVQHPPLPDDANASWAAHVAGTLTPPLVLDDLPGVPFCTHASYLARAGVPSVVLGPGDPIQAHTKDEWVACDAIEQGAVMYETFMRSVFQA